MHTLKDVEVDQTVSVVKTVRGYELTIRKEDAQNIEVE